MLTLLRRRSAVRMDRAGRYHASPQVVAVRQGERTILLDARRGRYFGLDAVGAEIWQALAGAEQAEAGATAAELAGRLEARYAAPPEQLERDAGEFLARLLRARLVVAA